MKICSSCNIEKPITEFHKDSSSKDGLRYYCKDCSTQSALQWRENNKERWKKNYKKYYSENQEIHRLKARENYLKNKEKHIERCSKYATKRRLLDPLYRFKHVLRDRTSKAFKAKNWNKKSKTQKILGADWGVVKSHIESRFKQGMTWDNYGEWQIDHIIPLSSAKTEKEMIQLCHYTNLQPLWAEENISKGNKIIACRINL